MSSLVRNIVLALGLAVILWLGYTIFLREPDSLVVAQNGTSDAAKEGQEFLALVQQVRAVNLDGAILNDARFDSLIDLRERITEEPYGRSNPFAPTSR